MFVGHFGPTSKGMTCYRLKSGKQMPSWVVKSIPFLSNPDKSTQP